MAVTYSTPDRLPNWAQVQWDHDAHNYESKVWFGVRCTDGPIQVVVTMPEEFAQPSPSRRRILQDMIEQLTVQLAKVTLEET
jgi:hypothetical protein